MIAPYNRARTSVIAAIAAITTIAASGSKLKAQPQSSGLQQLIDRVTAIEMKNLKRTAEGPAIPYLPCKPDRKDKWLPDLDLDRDGVCELEKRITEYARLGRMPVPICFNSGPPKVHYLFRRFLSFNYSLIAEQQKAGKSLVYYLSSSMGGGESTGLACARNFLVAQDTFPFGLEISLNKTLYSQSVPFRTVTYVKGSAPNTKETPRCPEFLGEDPQ